MGEEPRTPTTILDEAYERVSACLDVSLVDNAEISERVHSPQRPVVQFTRMPNTPSTTDLVQSQFVPVAERYVSSLLHAGG
jgi:hypothetical protein